MKVNHPLGLQKGLDQESSKRKNKEDCGPQGHLSHTQVLSNLPLQNRQFAWVDVVAPSSSAIVVVLCSMLKGSDPPFLSGLPPKRTHLDTNQWPSSSSFIFQNMFGHGVLVCEHIVCLQYNPLRNIQISNILEVQCQKASPGLLAQPR